MDEYKVSELCVMPDKKLFSMINETIQHNIDTSERSEYFISQLIASGMAYDEQHFEKIYSHCLGQYGMKGAYTKVVYPMLVRIGLMWASDSIPPANEHFISNIVRQKLFTAIDSLPPPKTTEEKWLLFLQENEFHELGLLFSSYIIRLSGRQVIYLGSDVPFQSLITAIKTIKPKYLLLFAVHRDLPEIIEEYLQKLSNTFSGKRIFIGGDEELIHQLRPLKKTHWLKSVDDLEFELSRTG